MNLPAKIPYYKNYGDYGHEFYVKLNPTGKWMLKLTHEGELKMYVQHRTILFVTWWIDEDYIQWLYPEVSKINHCK